MKEDELELWLEQIREDSRIYTAFYQNKEPDDTMGWEELIRVLLENEESKRDNGLLITGPEGCGRHTLLAQVIAVAVEKGYTPIFLTGEDLAEGTSAQAEVLERMNAVLDRSVGEEDILCLVLEQLEQLSSPSALLKLLERRLCRASCGEAEGFFLVLIQESAFPIPSVLKGMLQVCRMQYPNRGRRELFFKNHLRTDELRESFPMEKILDQTERFSYDELSNLVELLEAGEKLLGSKIPERELQEWIDGLRPEFSEKEAKQAFIGRLGQILEQLPEILSRPVQQMSTPQVQGEIQAGKSSSEPEMLHLTEADRMAKIEKETGEELMNNLFGKEFTDAEFKNSSGSQSADPSQQNSEEVQKT